MLHVAAAMQLNNILHSKLKLNVSTNQNILLLEVDKGSCCICAHILLGSSSKHIEQRETNSPEN